MTLRRYDGEGLGNAIRIVTLLFLTVVASWSGATAQLGHEPSHSPYRDVRRGGVGVLTFGYLGGGRGSVGVGLSDGTTGGIRYAVPFGAVGVSLGLAYGRTNRFAVDPTKDSSSPARTTALFASDVVLIDAGLQLVLTGRKTWRGFAPYVGGALGVAIGGTTSRDSSGYRFGTKFTLAPNAGLRWYIARRVSVRGDFRLVLATRPFWGRRAALTVVNTALAFPTVVVGLLLYGLLSRRGPLGGVEWLYTWQAIVVGDVVLAFPIAAALAAAAVQGVDPRI